MNAFRTGLTIALLTAGALSASCVGDDPINGGPGIPDTSDASNDDPPSIVTGGGSRDAASKPDVDSAGPSIVTWGNDYSPNTRPMIDVRAGRRVVSVHGSDSATQIEWFDTNGTKVRAVNVSSADLMEVTGIRLDDIGNAYLSITHTKDVTIETGSALVAVASSAQCSVIRLNAVDGMMTWYRSFSVPLPGRANCSVRRVMAGNVLVVAGFGGGTLTSQPGASTLQPSGNYDALVTTLSESEGLPTYSRKFGSVPVGDNREVSDINLRDAHFLTPTTIAVVGSTSSPKVDLGDSNKLTWTPFTTSLGQQVAGLYVRLDLLAPAKNTGEIWPVTHPTLQQEFYEAVMDLQSVTGQDEDVAVAGSCYATTGGSEARFVGTSALALGNDAAAFALGIRPSGRRLVHHAGPDAALFAETFMGLAQAADGRVTLIGASQYGLALGGPCDRGPRGTPAVYLATFTGAGLDSCTGVRELEGATPLSLAGTGATFGLSAVTTVPVSFAEYQAPANRTVVVDMPH